MSQYSLSVKPDVPKRLLTSGKYCDRDIVVSADVNLGTKNINKNGTFTAAGEGFDGFSSVSVNIVSGIAFGASEAFTFAERYLTSGNAYSASYAYSDSVEIVDDAPTLVDPVTETFTSLSGIKKLDEKFFVSSGTVYYVPNDANIREATITGSANATIGYKIVGNVQKVTVDTGAVFGTKEITENGTYTAADDGFDGFETVTVNVPILDTSGATATPEDMAEGVTAFVNGEEITGTNLTVESGSSRGWQNRTPKTNSNGQIGFSSQFSESGHSGILFRNGSAVYQYADPSQFGDAAASDVAAGKTFTSVSGLKVTGTRTEPTLTLTDGVLLIR